MHVVFPLRRGFTKQKHDELTGSYRPEAVIRASEKMLIDSTSRFIVKSFSLPIN
jgi:hypothetical protein